MLFIGMEVMEPQSWADSILSIQLSKVFQYEIMHNPLLLIILGIYLQVSYSHRLPQPVFIAFLSTGLSIVLTSPSLNHGSEYRYL